MRIEFAAMMVGLAIVVALTVCGWMVWKSSEPVSRVVIMDTDGPEMRKVKEAALGHGGVKCQ